MNKIEMIQTEVRKIVLSVNTRGWKMNKPSMKKWNEMLELPYSDVIVAVLAENGNRPDTKCDAIVSEIIKLGNDAGGKKDVYGDSYTTTISYSKATELYKALNFVEVVEVVEEVVVEVAVEMLPLDIIEDANGNIVVENLGGSTVEYRGELTSGVYKVVRRNRNRGFGNDWIGSE